MAATILSAKFIACELWVERVGTFGVVLYIHKCYIVKRILISFNCFSGYMLFYLLKQRCIPLKRITAQLSVLVFVLVFITLCTF